MSTPARKINSLLTCIQEAAAQRGTNPYQIAKATGLPLRSIQKLLTQTTNPTLRNVELILNGFGLSIYVLDDGRVTIAAGKRLRLGKVGSVPVNTQEDRLIAVSRSVCSGITLRQSAR